MSETTNKKLVSTLKVVPMMSKITEDKLTGLNYLDWSKTVHLYLRNIRMANHLTEDPPTDDSKDRWLEDDARLFLQICNFIDGKILTLINHCEFVKELMDYLEFVYSGKENISRIFDVCRAFYRSKKQDRSLTEFFMDYKKTYEELNVLLPFSPNVKVQQDWQEKMVAMGFLTILLFEYDLLRRRFCPILKFLL